MSLQSGQEVSRTYTAEQIAEILGVSIRQAYKICETTKDFKVLRMGRKCVRIHKDSFDRWLNEFDAPSI